MIRDLTKSTLSFSWGMTLFGAQQFANLLTLQSPAQPTHKAATAFDAVTQAAEGEFGDILKGAFRAGDQLQKGIIDLTFGFFTLQALNPSELMQTTSDVMTQTLGAFRQGMPGGSPGMPQEASGWGPVPPPGTY